MRQTGLRPATTEAILQLRESMGTHMGRTILGAVAGMVMTFITIMLIEFASHHFYPPPPGLNPMGAEDMATILLSVTLGAKLAVIVAWVVGAFDGGMVAALIAGRKRPRTAAMVPGLMVVAGVILIILQIPHPMLMSAAGLLLPIPAALAGAWLVGLARARKRP